MRKFTQMLNKKVLIRVAFVLVMLVWPILLNSAFALSVMSMAGLYATMALGLGLLLGQAGQISLGHAAFFGIGAYTSAILTTKLNVPPILAIVVGAALAGLFAYIVGRPILRLKSYFLALATMGLGEIFVVFARESKSLTGGQVGIVGIPYFQIGSFAFDDYQKQYYLVWGLVLILLFLTERILASRVGRALRALAVSDVAASTLGIHTADWKLRTFVLSAMYAGIGGGLYAFIMSAINYSNFSSAISMIVMIMVIVGGSSSLFGAVVGAVLMTWLGHAFSGYQEYSGSLYALVLILLLLFLPGGLVMGIQSRYIEELRRAVQSFSGGLLARLQLLPSKDSLPLRESLTSAQNTARTTPEIEEHSSATERWQLGGGKTGETSPVTNGEPLLRLEGVSVSFGGVQAVDQVSMTLQEGVISALIGPNGAGKTTLFNIISGLQKPTAGRVWFMGREITNYKAADIARLGIARTFQNLRLFGNMTVLENVMVGRHRHEKAGFITAALGLQAREEQVSRRRSMEALALVSLEHLADWPVMSLPYGQQRLVEIARALATEPRLLFLDEPAAGMNTSEKVQLMEKVQLIRKAGVTVLLVEHDMDLVMGISDSITVLNFGKLIAEGAPKEVQAHPEVIEAYVGVKHGEKRTAADEAAAAAYSRAIREGEDKPLLEVQNLCTNYGSISAIRDVSIQVYPGEIVAVLGSNGAGKTTLLRTISGLLRPRSGKVMYENRDIVNRPPQKISALGIGHVPEGRHIFPSLSVYDNLLLGACRRHDKKEIHKDCEFVYNLFPVLAERSTQIAGTLSGGQQQMLAIGRALMGKPSLLILDEPSMGLAPLVVELIFETLVKLNQQGLTMVIVEQNAEMLLSIAHHAFVLQTGRVALSGRAEDLVRDERVRALYLGHGQEEQEQPQTEGDQDAGRVASL